MTKKKKRIDKTVRNWQTGDYKPVQVMKFEFPVQFLMLCKLANVTPQQMLLDFVDNLSFGLEA